MILLKFAWTATLFTIGIVHNSSWRTVVLDQWSMNCTLLPHPAPYPFELQRLANGEASWHGIKQLFNCVPDPEWEAFFKRLRATRATSQQSEANAKAGKSRPVPALRFGAR